MQTLQKLQTQFEGELKDIKNIKQAEDLRVKYLGKSGLVRQAGQEVKNLKPEERKQFGQELNNLKSEIERKLSASAPPETDRQKLEAPNNQTKKEIDPQLLPGAKPETGHLHLITQAIEEIVSIFEPLGFNRVRYPEVDWEYYAFEALNMGRDHPARDEFETFFIDSVENKKFGKMVITPQTSNGQVRHMLEHKPPIRMLNIARCGRRQVDISHNPSFYQFEGLVVDKGINITHLKWVLTYFAKNFFGADREIRLRPYDFRFTEPSFEVDISCGLCKGQGCRTCKEGWMELGGAGMVHPYVLKAGGVDPREYSGFAFGWGVERTYMMKSGLKLPDIRLLFSNDLRVLEQF
ncbi:MAG: phenylalanine--tRNA ligase subunit alpha [bacterium]